MIEIFSSIPTADLAHDGVVVERARVVSLHVIDLPDGGQVQGDSVEQKNNASHDFFQEKLLSMIATVFENYEAN